MGSEMAYIIFQIQSIDTVKVKVTRSCPTLCDPMDYTVHGILQARILEWVAFPFSRGSSQPRDWTRVSCIAGRFFTNWAMREAQSRHNSSYRFQGKECKTGWGTSSVVAGRCTRPVSREHNKCLCAGEGSEGLSLGAESTRSEHLHGWVKSQWIKIKRLRETEKTRRGWHAEEKAFQETLNSHS